MDLADRLAAHLNPLAPENLDPSGTLVRRAPIPPAHVRATTEVALPERVQVFETGEAPLPVIGQGTVVVSVANARELLFALPQADNGDDDGRALYALISSDGCALRVAPAGATSFAEASADALVLEDKPGPLVKEARYLVPGPEPDTYWLSVDKKNGIIRYGRGYVNLSQALYEVTLGVFDKENGVCKWADKKFQFIERLAKVQILQFGGDKDAKVQFSSQYVLTVAYESSTARNATSRATSAGRERASAACGPERVDYARDSIKRECDGTREPARRVPEAVLERGRAEHYDQPRAGLRHSIQRRHGRAMVQSKTEGESERARIQRSLRPAQHVPAHHLGTRRG
jgi:hypothetical protein